MAEQELINHLEEVAEEEELDLYVDDDAEQSHDDAYEYDMLLNRAQGNNPDIAVRQKTAWPTPKVLREGTRKTVLANFINLCNVMHRQPDHVTSFLLAELGTTGSLDGQQRLVVKGRFAPKNFEGILRRYINDYVICNGCKSADTILSKENRLMFLRCEQCGSGRSVGQISKGYQAIIGRRKVAA